MSPSRMDRTGRCGSSKAGPRAWTGRAPKASPRWCRRAEPTTPPPSRACWRRARTPTRRPPPGTRPSSSARAPTTLWASSCWRRRARSWTGRTCAGRRRSWWRAPPPGRSPWTSWFPAGPPSTTKTDMRALHSSCAWSTPPWTRCTPWWTGAPTWTWRRQMAPPPSSARRASAIWTWCGLCWRRGARASRWTTTTSMERTP
mmetsp:Transcript_28768/g.55125  ORF Transcript_28768/g.55125 Transcript_28768/m.55125 type:complete len:201 (+) Transcript_28768:310-912(+)